MRINGAITGFFSLREGISEHSNILFDGEKRKKLKIVFLPIYSLQPQGVVAFLNSMWRKSVCKSSPLRSLVPVSITRVHIKREKSTGRTLYIHVIIPFHFFHFPFNF